MSGLPRTLRTLAILTSIAVIALLATARPAASANAAATSAGRTAAATQTVVALLTEMRIAIDHTSVPAGTVTFLVQNLGAITHELVVLKTDYPIDALPADPVQAGKIFEDIHMGETGDVSPGAFTGFIVTLVPGHYVLVCDEPDHYTAGMRVPFTVTAPEVTIDLEPTAMTVDQSTVLAGRILFTVTNAERTTEQVAILRSDGSLLTTAALQSAAIEPSAFAGATATVAPAQTKQFAITLGVGRYVLICIENGEYELDAQATFTVVAPPTLVPYQDPGAE